MTRFERWAIWAASLLLTATGVAFFWMKYGLQPQDPWAVVNHPLQPLVLKLHILAAPLLVFAVGIIAVKHVWRHFQNGVTRGRGTGIVLTLMTAPMIATGYLIQVVTAEGWLRAMAWSHIGCGVVYAVGLAAHQLRIRNGNGTSNGGKQGAERARRPADAVGRGQPESSVSRLSTLPNSATGAAAPPSPAPTPARGPGSAVSAPIPRS